MTQAHVATLSPAPDARLLQPEHNQAHRAADQHRAAVVELFPAGSVSPRDERRISTSATIATGTLIQKIERHVHCVRKPPAIGPIAVRPPEMPKKIAIARPRSRTGYEGDDNPDGRRKHQGGKSPPESTRKLMIQASAIAPLGREPAAGGCNRESDHTDDNHPSPTEYVAKPAAEREQCRERQQVSVDDPLRACRRQRQLRLDLRNRDRDDRLIDEGHCDREHHCGQYQILVGWTTPSRRSPVIDGWATAWQPIAVGKRGEYPVLRHTNGPYGRRARAGRRR